MDDDIHKSGIVTGLQNLLSSSQYSDMIVRSGSEEFKVHRAIICPRSKFFAAACNGPFQEGKTGIVTLEDDDTPTVRRMLNYLYTLDYDDNGDAASVTIYAHGKGANANLQATIVPEGEQLSAHDPPDYHELMNNIAVYAIADKYDIPELEVLAVTKFKKALHCSDIVEDLASLPAIIDAVFDTTPDTKCGLRNVMINYCTDWKEEIIANGDSVAVVRDHGEIGLAMIRQMCHERDQKETLMEAQIRRATMRENIFRCHLQRISCAADQHRGLGNLRGTIQQAKDSFNELKINISSSVVVTNRPGHSFGTIGCSP